MIAALALGWVATARAGIGDDCVEQNPIAGSAGFANAQSARRTNRMTYSAANFADRALADGAPPGQWVTEFNVTLNAARVPTYCAGGGPDSPVLYEAPLDLYAANLAFTVSTPTVGAFYSASVTQSVLDQRILALPAALLQLYPLVSAPVVGVWQRGDGVSSYALDWIGGVTVDTRWFGARAGYTGIGGAYASFDERILGLFGTTAVPFEDQLSPFSFLAGGLDRFEPSRFSESEVLALAGMTSLFFRDLPYGDEPDEVLAQADSDTAPTGKRVPVLFAGAAGGGAAGEGARLAAARLRTLHFTQQNIGAWVDVDVSYALSPKLQIFDGMVAVHSPGYVAGRLVDEKGKKPLEPGFLVKLGVVRLPPQYALGVEGGTYFAARAEYRPNPYVYFLVLFNDPEQLALYPFATNAVTVRANVDFDFKR